MLVENYMSNNLSTIGYLIGKKKLLENITRFEPSTIASLANAKYPIVDDTVNKLVDELYGYESEEDVAITINWMVMYLYHKTFDADGLCTFIALTEYACDENLPNVNVRFSTEATIQAIFDAIVLQCYDSNYILDIVKNANVIDNALDNIIDKPILEYLTKIEVRQSVMELAYYRIVDGIVWEICNSLRSVMDYKTAISPMIRNAQDLGTIIEVGRDVLSNYIKILKNDHGMGALIQTACSLEIDQVFIDDILERMIDNNIDFIHNPDMTPEDEEILHSKSEEVEVAVFEDANLLGKVMRGIVFEILEEAKK